MITQGENTLREVLGISQDESQRICDFLQGAVYCWCKNRKNEWFSMRDLMGGENRDWAETPLHYLYDKHIEIGKSEAEAFEKAGIDSGWLLKKTINNDYRTFETKEEDQIRKYRWA